MSWEVWDFCEVFLCFTPCFLPGFVCLFVYYFLILNSGTLKALFRALDNFLCWAVTAAKAPISVGHWTMRHVGWDSSWVERGAKTLCTPTCPGASGWNESQRPHPKKRRMLGPHSQWSQNQPGDSSIHGGGQRCHQIAAGGPRKMLETQASNKMEPGKERKKTRALHTARPTTPFWRCPGLEPQTPQEDPHSSCADFSQGRPCTGMSLESLRCSHFLLFFLSWITITSFDQS